MLDEAYAEFAPESHVDLVNYFDNLAVCRTFSKAFGLAGLRLGYAVLDRELARRYNKHMLEFSVNQLAVEGGVAALSDRVFLERTVSMAAHGQQYLREKLPMKTYRPKRTSCSLTLRLTPHEKYRNICCAEA